MNGWTGKLLRVNLSTGTTAVESSEKYFKYIGGKGMANRIMYEEVPAGTDPIAPENKVVFAIGPNTGSGAPCSGRVTLATLSPFTKFNAIVDGHVGGDLGVQMKAAGYDAIIIEGVSDKPVYLNINDDTATVEDASDLWGTTTSETTKTLAIRHGKGVNVTSIGPAGENLLNLSCVITGVAHCAGGGVGKILGSKKLKAMVIYGTGSTEVADPKAIIKLNDYVMNDLIGSNNNHVVPSVAQSWSEYENQSTRWTGRPGLTWGGAEGGPVDTGESPPGEPTKVGFRCQKAVFDHGMVAENYTAKMTGCALCPIRCYGSLKLPKLNEIDSPDTAHANTCLGARPYVNLIENHMDFEVEGDGRMYAGMFSAILADDYGLWDNYGDLHATLQYFLRDEFKLMKAILTDEEYNAIDWTKYSKGDPTFIRDILDCVVNPNHTMSKLAQGAYYVSEEFKDVLGDEYLHSSAMTMWGPIGAKRHHGNECDAQVGMLTNILYNRDGMCHTIVNITGSGLPYDVQKGIVEDIFGEGCLDRPRNYTPMNESKARFAKFGVMRQVLHDSFTLCNWVWPMSFSPRKDRDYKGDLSVEAQYMAAITGDDSWTEESLDHATERCIQLHRAMTVMSVGDTDMRNLHDVVSENTFEVDPDIAPFEEGTVKLDREDWQLALTMFYKEFGWDEKTGAPTRETLEKFDLADVADELESKGLLP